MTLWNKQVQLTWDETDHERVAAMSRKFNKDELLDMDFNVYLASSSSEEEEEELEDIASATSATVEEEEEKEDKEKKIEQQQEKRKKEKKSEQQISKYRELLRGLQDKEKKLQEDKDMEMEITWVPGDAFTKLQGKACWSS